MHEEFKNEKCAACGMKFFDDSDIRPRCEITSPEAAQYYKDLGVRDFCLNDEMSALRRFWFNEGKKLRDLVNPV